MLSQINVAATLMFVLVTSITPGPGNLTSASMGVLHGYRKTLPFLLGISSGFFIIMLVCGLVSTALIALLPGVEQWLRWIGAAYILWLAWHVLRSSIAGDPQQQEVLGYGRGLGLVLLNPKAYVFGLTLYGSMMAPLAGQLGWMLLSALLLSVECLAVVSIWTLFGTSIHVWLHHPTAQRAANAVLALLLAYTAVDLSGLLKLL